jgi:hypothetical protein
VFFPPGVYYLGEVITPERLLKISRRSGVILSGYGATPVCRTLENVIPYIIALDEVQGARIEGLVFVDLGYDVGQMWRGATAVVLEATRGPCERITLEGLFGRSLVGLTMCRPSKHRIVNVDLTASATEDCMYGAVFQNNGDFVSARLSTRRTLRSYFVYGASFHDAWIYSDQHASSSADVLLKTYSRPTRLISLRYYVRASMSEGYHVALEHQHEADRGEISGISLTCFSEDDLRGNGVVFRAYDKDDQIRAETDSTWRDISVRCSGEIGLRALSRPPSVADLVLQDASGSVYLDHLPGFRVSRVGNQAAQGLSGPPRACTWMLSANPERRSDHDACSCLP